MKRLVCGVFLLLSAANGQIYDLLLKNGRVIDPANRREGQFDIAIVGKRIARVAPNLPAAHARVVIDAGAYAVVPGLIDVGAHIGEGGRNLQADHNCLPYGVTTVVGADSLAHDAADRPKTRVLPFRPMNGESSKAMYGATLSFPAASAAIRAGALPELIATGLDRDSVMLIRADMMTTLSKLLNLGMTLEQLVERTTVNPARALGQAGLGALTEGAAADIAVLEIRQGKFGFVDAEQKRLAATRRLRCVLTVRDGAVVWDSQGLSAIDWVQAGPYSNYK